jgi:acyl-CoA thioesterase
MNALAPDDYCASPILSERIAALLARDTYVTTMAVRLVSVSPGRAELAMEVAPALANVHGACHGGALFTLADLAFGAAAIYGGPVLTTGADFNFVRTAPLGAIVRASASELSRTAKTGLFQVTLSEEATDVLAIGTFRGLWTRAAPGHGEPSLADRR